MNTQDLFPLGWTGWISLQSKELSRVFSNTVVQKHQFFGAQLSSLLISTLLLSVWLRTPASGLSSQQGSVLLSSWLPSPGYCVPRPPGSKQRGGLHPAPDKAQGLRGGPSGPLPALLESITKHLPSCPVGVGIS